MLTTVKTLVQNLHEENQMLKEENKTLKQRLQHSHTTINDLRYSKRLLSNALEEKKSNVVWNKIKFWKRQG